MGRGCREAAGEGALAESWVMAPAATPLEERQPRQQPERGPGPGLAGGAGGLAGRRGPAGVRIGGVGHDDAVGQVRVGKAFLEGGLAREELKVDAGLDAVLAGRAVRPEDAGPLAGLLPGAEVLRDLQAPEIEVHGGLHAAGLLSRGVEARPDVQVARGQRRIHGDL
jgi:hypothetical protein